MSWFFVILNHFKLPLLLMVRLKRLFYGLPVREIRSMKKNVKKAYHLALQDFSFVVKSRYGTARAEYILRLLTKAVSQEMAESRSAYNASQRQRSELLSEHSICSQCD